MARTYGLFVVVVVALFCEATHALPPQKIVGGGWARPGEFPFMASLRYDGEHFCGGSIVSTRHVVTAAHCIYHSRVVTPMNFRVATGSIFYDGGDLHDVAKVITYPHFIFNNDLLNDLSIMVLATDIIFSAFQHSIALPMAPTPANVVATTAGWGYQDVSKPVFSKKLRKVQLHTLHKSVCRKYLAARYYIQNCHICTYTAYGTGTCHADSGGPLVYNGQLIGVVSFGIPCGVGQPDVFTNVYQYVGWILMIIATE